MATTKTTPKKKSTTSKATSAAKPQPSASDGISIEGSRETIPVHLVGTDYDAKPPKAMIMIRFSNMAESAQENPESIINIADEYVHAAFSKQDADDIMDRLNDSEDDLDIMHVMQLLEKMTELTTGNPTT